MRLAVLCLLWIGMGTSPVRAQTAPAVERVWIKSPSWGAAAPPIAPEVQAVDVQERFVIVRSAGLSLQSFGALQAGPIDESKATRQLMYRIPRQPQPGPSDLPAAVIGTFVNGMPIYNLTTAMSYQDANLWHVDMVAAGSTETPLLQALLQRRQVHSPIIGYALDGYPVYGPFGWDREGRVVRMHSSYRLRTAKDRRTLPSGVTLTPAQQGPAVSADFPAGTFVEDYEYLDGGGELDRHNGRFAVTPEYPQGTYAYFLSTHDDGTLAYPYLIGTRYRGQRHDERKGPSTVEMSDGALTMSLSREGAQVHLIFRAGAAPLERVHEKLMHVLIVSDDLSRFDHVHPEARTAAALELDYTFPAGGKYWIYADYTPAGEAQTIARFAVTIPGEEAARARLSENREARVGGVLARLEVDGPLTTARDVTFRFYLSGAATGGELHDLQPYLGAWGHIMMVSEDKVDFVHAHPKESLMAGASPWQHAHATVGEGPAMIETTSGFRRSGRYKIWLQVQRGGAVLTFPFVVHVNGGALKPVSRAIPEGAIRVRVDEKGYHPARIAVAAGRPVTLAFIRNDAQNCGGRVVFPALGIDQKLAPGATTLVTLPGQAAQELTFSCGMGMMRGAVVMSTVAR